MFYVPKDIRKSDIWNNLTKYNLFRIARAHCFSEHISISIYSLVIWHTEDTKTMYQMSQFVQSGEFIETQDKALQPRECLNFLDLCQAVAMEIQVLNVRDGSGF